MIQPSSLGVKRDGEIAFRIRRDEFLNPQQFGSSFLQDTDNGIVVLSSKNGRLARRQHGEAKRALSVVSLDVDSRLALRASLKSNTCAGWNLLDSREHCWKER
ncbi:unnamed protein product [Colias eurytheme]|nr:unnamed protein product [Colias eurytheme]